MGKDHADAKGSCWWEKIILVGKDHVGGKGCWWLWRMVPESTLCAPAYTSKTEIGEGCRGRNQWILGQGPFLLEAFGNIFPVFLAAQKSSCFAGSLERA